MGTAVASGDEAASIETMKTEIVVPAPVGGTVVEINPALEMSPEVINEDPLYAEITRYPILFTPGLVINEKLVCAGRIPKVEEVVAWLREVLDGARGG